MQAISSESHQSPVHQRQYIICDYAINFLNTITVATLRKVKTFKKCMKCTTEKHFCVHRPMLHLRCWHSLKSLTSFQVFNRMSIMEIMGRLFWVENILNNIIKTNYYNFRV